MLWFIPTLYSTQVLIICSSTMPSMTINEWSVLERVLSCISVQQGISNWFWVMHRVIDQAPLFSRKKKIHMDIWLIRKPVFLECIHSRMLCLQFINLASKTWNVNVAHVSQLCIHMFSWMYIKSFITQKALISLCTCLHVSVCVCVCVCVCVHKCMLVHVLREKERL